MHETTLLYENISPIMTSNYFAYLYSRRIYNPRLREDEVYDGGIFQHLSSLSRNERGTIAAWHENMFHLLENVNDGIEQQLKENNG